ncbi:accessory gland protein Acp29AB-like [Drosophila takahashii]|uniref:accessory gland protein Acp29AB-like n=1 Tax=Drosophila takahashii TaxID=29030 RepID=UPI0007E61AAE|nr:accessory gland protein Acp29AB-like [Drosophila takahashii]
MLRLVVSLFVLNFFGPLSAFQDNGSFICQVTDAPSQCGAFCLAALHPLFDDNQRSWAKLNQIDEKVEWLRTKLENQENSMQAKLDAQLQAIQKMLKDQNSALAQSGDTRGRLQTQNLNGNQLLTPQNQPTLKIIDPRFELIGSTFFYIEKFIKKTWDEAAGTCREMGGSLAAFKTQEEITAIMPKLNKAYYWTGIKKKDGEFVSSASGKWNMALKWPSGEPNDDDNET